MGYMTYMYIYIAVWKLNRRANEQYLMEIYRLDSPIVVLYKTLLPSCIISLYLLFRFLSSSGQDYIEYSSRGAGVETTKQGILVCLTGVHTMVVVPCIDAIPQDACSNNIHKLYGVEEVRNIPLRLTLGEHAFYSIIDSCADVARRTF